MVSCLTCYKELPYGCTCDISPEEKLNRWLESAQREIELVKALGKGFKPSVRVKLTRTVGDETEILLDYIELDVEKITDYWYRLFFSMKAKGYQVLVALLDVNGKKLYEKDITSNLALSEDDMLTVSWYVGIPPKEERI
jgi:hypothetical protein